MNTTPLDAKKLLNISFLGNSHYTANPLLWGCSLILKTKLKKQLCI